MCYAAPGPRCSTHTRAMLDAAIRKASERPTDKHMEAVKTARTAWRRTPDGIETLKAEGHAELAGIYEAERAEMLAMYQVVKGGKKEKDIRVKRLTASTLTARDGWTKGAVERFLGEPDVFAENPNYRSGPPMRLYDLSRVIEAEMSEDFKAFVTSNAGRVAGAAKSVRTRTQQLLAEVAAMPMTLKEKRSLEEVTRAAYGSWKANKDVVAWERGWEDPSHERFEELSDDFKNRVTVNYLRHERTEYDNRLEDLSARAGKEQAYSAIRNRIFGMIAERYPDLANECKSQGWEGVPAAA